MKKHELAVAGILFMADLVLNLHLGLQIICFILFFVLLFLGERGIEAQVGI